MDEVYRSIVLKKDDAGFLYDEPDRIYVFLFVGQKDRIFIGSVVVNVRGA